ncbi:MAG: hypothetical protein LBV05_04240 [Comamonas sp.]|jgi:hypothetical protein|uniref:hypothetical protein n=1 Tax=Comamonas sp. TaxID=34028 RepID=UPI00284AE888|nr:hypothetical protein [Comamonas sp.]MDR3064708.1 hypothetical protein [Comamonas sp.]
MTDTTKYIAQLGHLSKAQKAALGAVLNALQGLSPGDAQEALDHATAHLAGDEHTPMFARGIAGPFGKLDTPAKTWLDSRTDELFRRKAAERNQDGSSAQRDCMYAWVYGKTYTLMVAEKALHDANAMDIRAQMAVPFEGREFGGHGR